MPDRPNPLGRPAPIGRLPTRSFRRSGPVPKAEPPPSVPTPVAPAAPQPQPSKSGRVPQQIPADGPIDHDIACGVLAGIFDPGPHVVTPDTLTVVNPVDKSQKSYREWIRPNDVVGALARMFLAARQNLTEVAVPPPVAPPPPAFGGRSPTPTLGGRLTPTSAPAPAPLAPTGQKTQQQLARDEAVARHQELRRQIYDVLRFRDAIDRAQKKGFRVLYTPPETPSGSVRRTPTR